MWNVFRGCGHSFHIVCTLPDISDCPICRTVLSKQVEDLGQTANNSVSNASVPSAAGEESYEDDLSDDDDDEDDQQGDDQNETVNIDTLIERIRHWRTPEPTTE
jgi:hypothetical protein